MIRYVKKSLYIDRFITNIKRRLSNSKCNQYTNLIKKTKTFLFFVTTKYSMLIDSKHTPASQRIWPIIQPAHSPYDRAQLIVYWLRGKWNASTYNYHNYHPNIHIKNLIRKNFFIEIYKTEWNENHILYFLYNTKDIYTIIYCNR